MLLSILQGFLLGLGAAVPIGPVNVELARRTLRGGFTAGVALGCGAVTVDVTFAALTSLSLMHLLDRPGLHFPLLVAGTCILTFLGITCLVSARKPPQDDDSQAQVPIVSLRRNYLTGLVMTLMNPFTLAFWVVAVPAAGARTHEMSLVWFCVGVFGGTVCWVVCFAYILSILHRFRQAIWIRRADIAGGIILLFFALLGGFAILRHLGILGSGK